MERSLQGIGRPTVLVLAAVGDTPGYLDKYRGWTEGFRDAGCEATLVTHLTPAELHRVAPRPFDVTMVRSDPGALAIAPFLREQAMRGSRIVAEVPTPLSVATREVVRAPMSVSQRVRLGRAFARTQGVWRPAHLIVQTADEGLPWRLLGPRRITLTNGARSAPHSCSAWSRRASLRFVFSGHYSHWHGIDRLLRGMKHHPESELMLVGPPDRFAAPLELARRLGLGARVRVLGELDYEGLFAAMDDADVGVSGLALSRIGRIGFSPLKSRAYISAGLPIIYADRDPDLESTAFAMRVPSGGDAVDVAAVHRWLSGLRGGAAAPEAIRAFAAERFSYRARAEAVLDALGLAVDQAPTSGSNTGATDL